MTHTDCHDLLGDLSDFLDGEASARLCEEIRLHMAGCERCRIVVDTLRKTVSLYHHLPQPTLPDEARERLYKTLHLSGHLRSK
jgi:anti-sigma factor RsiW